MKLAKRCLATLMASIICVSLLTMTVFAATPRWANANSISTSISPANDCYTVDVDGITGTTKIEITATLKEKNIFGIYVEKDTTSGTYYSRTAIMTGTYDMSTSKDYKVTAVVKVTANGVTETIEV